MSKVLPDQKPKFSHLEALNILGAHGVKTPLAFLAIRGPRQFLDMGVKGKNDRRLYDDVIMLVGSKIFFAINANTDPNGFREGHGVGGNKGMASLKEGVHLYKPGLHKGRPAFVQAEKFTVYRDADKTVPANEIKILDGRKVYEEVGFFGINFHDSPESSTSSLGCQTAPKPQYVPFRALAVELMKQYGMKTIPYCLTRE